MLHVQGTLLAFLFSLQHLTAFDLLLLYDGLMCVGVGYSALKKEDLVSPKSYIPRTHTTGSPAGPLVTVGQVKGVQLLTE